MNTLLVDPPAAPDSERPPTADRQAGGSTSPPAGEASPAAAGGACGNCGSPLGDGQQWCLQCGAGQPGSLGGGTSWRPLTTLAVAAAVLVVGAAAAGAAALDSHKSPKRLTPLTVAQAPVASAPGVTGPTATTPTAPGTASTPTIPSAKATHGGSGSGSLFPTTGKPPKIPSPTSTPESSGSTNGGGSGTETTSGSEPKSSETTTSTPKSEPKGGSETKAQGPSAILLDTDAASTYNPYKYPETGFGDPALAIDGEPLTAWTAQVQPSSAPQMAEGLLIDLKTPTKLGALKLVTLSPGMTVQVYGANGHKAPATITEPGWTQISSSHVLKKKTRLKLRTGEKSFRFVVVWLVKAPASATGTPQTPSQGQVQLNEVELFPPAS